MTDRHTAYVVILENDIREDDAEATITALRMVRGVASVQPIVKTTDHIMATERAKYDLGRRIQAAVTKEIRETV